MSKPTLYLMLGYPGAGKTTTAKVIAKLTGATHLWEDKVRLEMFQKPGFQREENNKLHTYLNQLTDELLQQGKSVVFDTSFNQYEDRVRMYAIAAKNEAQVLLIWVQTAEAIAKYRATVDAASQPTRVLATVIGDMDDQTFERLKNKLEQPQKDEQAITVDGTRVTDDYIRSLLPA